MTIQNRLMFLGLATVLLGGFVYSQIFIHEKNRGELKEIARELALSWKDKLGLSLKQAALLEDIIIAYTIRKNEIINANLPQKNKIERLQKVQSKEHKNLKKFLSDEQFDAYVGINRKIPNPIMDSLLVQ